ncbi:MAG: AAA family ATPase, partial [Pseudanabaena sp.]
MFTEVQIENYKSIQNLKINLGRVNVFIGENGCGKTNILEAIALAGAATGNKLDNEFLAPRGIRVTEPEFMRSAFEKENTTKYIEINLKGIDKTLLNFVLQNENKPYSNWTKINTFYENGKTLNISNKQTLTIDLLNTKTDNPFSDYMNQHIANKMQINKEQITFSIQELMGQISNDLKQSSLNLDSFLIYSPEKSLL